MWIFSTPGGWYKHTLMCHNLLHFFFRLPAASLSVFSHWQVARKCQTELFCEGEIEYVDQTEVQAIYLWLNAL